MKKSEQAVERFEDGFNCSQAVLVSYCQQFGLDQELGSKIATAFGGGMHLGSVCGAVTGAFIVLGLKYGNTTAATIPLCLWEWESQLKKGDNIILAAFGGGFTWGSLYLKWAYDGNKNND